MCSGSLDKYTVKCTGEENCYNCHNTNSENIYISPQVQIPGSTISKILLTTKYLYKKCAGLRFAAATSPVITIRNDFISDHLSYTNPIFNDGTSPIGETSMQ